MRQEKKFYLVSEDILPEAILRTALAKELLAQGTVNVEDAVREAGLARSTFYKYREGIFPFFDAENTKIITLSFALRHQPGVLSKVLNYVASQKGNILTINQGLPLQGTANVTLAVDVEEMLISVEDLVLNVSNFEGVLKSELIGRS
ncbi:MAG: ACT domain-containing protein [Chitinophagales bacterium]